MNRRRFLQASASAVAAMPLLARGATTQGFEIGLTTDAQYADIEPKGTRYYRASVARLGEAVEYFNRRELAFCAHLGDLIDREWRSFDEILAPLGKSRHRWHQLLGNHDFDVLEEQKRQVPGRMGMQRRYGSFDYQTYRFVILDTNDVSTYAHAKGSSENIAAAAELKRLEAAQLKQAKSWNGGVGATQLAWFEQTCRAAAAAKLRVIVLAHHPTAPDDLHNIWNAEVLLAAIDRHPHVVAWLNGHNHAGNYSERNGVHYLTMRGMVETPDKTAFATARVLADRMILEGHGREPSRELRWRSA